jgi:5-methylcytosine-specific restriction protein A
MSVPQAVPRYCAHYPCGNTVTTGRYCPEHAGPARQNERRHYTGTPGINYGRPWRRLRLRYLAEHPYCVDCGAVLDLEVDHQIPHEGDPELFWDEANWRTRCKPCHSRKTAGEVARR